MNFKKLTVAAIAAITVFAISCSKSNTPSTPSTPSNPTTPTNPSNPNNPNNPNNPTNPTAMLEFKINGVKYTGHNVVANKTGTTNVLVIINSHHFRGSVKHNMTVGFQNYTGVGAQGGHSIHFSRQAVDTVWQSNTNSINITKDDGKYIEGTFSAKMHISQPFDSTSTYSDTVSITDGKFIAKWL